MAPLELSSERFVHRQMFFKTGVLKILKHFTVKNLCQSLFLIKFIKNSVQQRFFRVKFATFL